MPGLILAIFGSAVSIGEWRGPPGLAFALFALINRVNAADALMAEAFGAAKFWRLLFICGSERTVVTAAPAK
jgi:hypothetical protein